MNSSYNIQIIFLELILDWYFRYFFSSIQDKLGIIQIMVKHE